MLTLLRTTTATWESTARVEQAAKNARPGPSPTTSRSISTTVSLAPKVISVPTRGTGVRSVPFTMTASQEAPNGEWEG